MLVIIFLLNEQLKLLNLFFFSIINTESFLIILVFKLNIFNFI